MEVIKRAWKGYRATVMPKGASQRQVNETRLAFYAGASVLFATMTSEHFFDDEGEGDIDPTGDDLAKMQAIQDEVDGFGAELDLAVLGIRRH